MAFDDCMNEVRDAIGPDGLRMDNDQIGRYFDDVHLRAEKLRRERVDLSDAELLRAAAEEMGAEARMATAIEIRNAKMNALKRAKLHERATTIYDGDPVLGIKAILGGANTKAKGNRRSVAAEQSALREELVDGVTRDLDNAGLLTVMREGTLDREISRELFELNRENGQVGVSGSVAAKDAAKIIDRYQKAAVALLNKEGAWIGQYEGFIASTAHDPDLVLKAGFQKWREFVEPRLDERTFEGVEDREKFLHSAWKALSDGVHLSPDGITGFKDPAFKGPRNVAKGLSQGRKLHWKDAAAWHEYFQAYAGKQFIAHVLAGLDGSARAAGLMRTFGTNPRAEFDALLARVTEEAHLNGDVETARQVKAQAAGLTHLFEVIDGTTSRPNNRMAAQVGGAIRAIQSMSKLGGVTLSAIADVPVAASEMRFQGVNLLEAYGNQLSAIVKGRGSGEAREVADLLLAGFEGMRDEMLSRIVEMDGPPGRISKLANVFFRATGLVYWTDAQRVGARMIMSRHLGNQRGKAWGDLPEELRNLLPQFEIGEAEWKALHGVEWASADGRAHLTPDRARMIGDDVVDGVIGDKLDGIRAQSVDAVTAAMERLNTLEERLSKTSEELEALNITPDDIDTAITQTVMEGIERRRKTIGDLRGAVVRMRDGKAGASDVARKVAREVERLARDAQAIGDRGRARVERIKSQIPKEAAKREALTAKLDRHQQQMLRALDVIAETPDRMERAVAQARDDWRDDLALKLRTYFTDRTDIAVLTPGARERAWLTQGTKGGSVVGEAVRFITQFKAFPVAVISKVWGREAYGGQAGWGKGAGMVHMAVASTLFGYLAMTAKDLAKGQTPRDAADPRTWGAAMVQGGGAGIMGDFLFGSYNRFGRSLTATLAGPTLGSADAVAELFTRAREGDDLAAASLRFGLSNTPFINLFYTRAALDYLFLYQIQEAVNPGFLRRFEKSVKEKTGKTFLSPPSRAIPYGGGDRWFEGVRQ